MAQTKTKRPDMRDYFRGRIDWHVNGMMAGSMARLPRGVRRCEGDVTAQTITVVMEDGSEFRWKGGQFASRKVNGTYAPLMPKPID
jgi:hypothetical protein